MTFGIRDRSSLETVTTRFFGFDGSEVPAMAHTDVSGLYQVKSWSGQDKFPSAKRPIEPPPSLESDADGNIKWADFVRNGTKPARAYSMEHDYNMTYERASLMPYTAIYPRFSGYTVGRVENVVPSRSVHYQVYDPYPSLRISCINKLAEKSNRRVNVAVFAAEAPQAVRMIANNVTDIAEAIWHVRHGRMRSAASALGVSPKRGMQDRYNIVRSTGEVSARWLELQYGWLPTLKDIRGGAEFLAHHFNVPAVLRLKARAFDPNSHQLLVGATGSGYAIDRLQVVALLSEPPNVAQLAGLVDPASLIWELTPFSFVADWAWPIGDWLGARNFLSWLPSATFVVTKSQKFVYSGRDAISDLTVQVGSLEYDRVFVDRKVGEQFSLPLPPPTRLDQIIPSWTRAANAVALLRQVCLDPVESLARRGFRV